MLRNMRQPRSIRDLDDWVRFTDDRPPLVFSVFFWGDVLLLALNFVSALSSLGAVTERWPLLETIFYAGGAALPPLVVLWPLLSWRRGTSAWRKAVTVAFLALSLVVASSGGSRACWWWASRWGTRWSCSGRGARSPSPASPACSASGSA
ncbi:hypothetical protein ACFQQB_02645 [Nonomuraea rubra]|uniref:hypothetical protein n=1 Tax=Nonomuraea rubra TaxID=46180 RepID=UPI00360B4688